MQVDRELEAKRREECANSEDAFASLKRFAGSAPRVERCELCGAAVEVIHRHLLDRKTGAIACACGTCALLFSNQQEGRFLRIPPEVRAVRDLASDPADLEWEALALPIDLVFFIRSADGRLWAKYPSPAGAIESSLPLEGVGRTLASSSAAGMQPDVQALLVSRITGDEAAYLMPIDECYRLTGLIRLKWRGLSGGTDVRIAIRDFLAEMRARAGMTAGDTDA